VTISIDSTKNFKGLVSQDGASTEIIGVVPFRPKQFTVSLSHTPIESRASKVYDATNIETVDVRWWVLEFTHVLSSALKYCGLPQQE
jgi:hypothetical protein